MSRVRIAAVLVFVISLVVTALIATDAIPVLRGPAPLTDVWHWPYLLRPAGRWWPAVLSGVLLAAVGAWWVTHESHEVWPVLVVTGLALGLQLGIIYADRPAVGAELVDRTLSKDTSGYAAVAGEIDALGPALRGYPQLMAASDNEHVRTHPPGLVAGFWLTDHALRLWPTLAQSLASPVRAWRCTDLWVLSRPPATAASLLLGSWVPVLAAALTPIAAYYVARRLLRGAAIALAAVLTASIPALLVFSPTPDQVYALLSLVSLWLLLKGLAQRSVGWLGLSGLVMSGMTLLSIGNAAWVGLLGVYALISVWCKNWPLRSMVAGFVAFAAGIASLWLVYWAGWGVAPWSIISVGLDQHYQLVTSQRDYLTWLAYNPLDFLLFAGLAVVVGWGGLAVAAGVRRNWLRSEAGLMAILLVAVLLVLNLSGSTRGEVGRLWLVFMPLAAVLAAGGWAAAAGSSAPSKPQQPDMVRSGRTMPFSRLDVLLIIAAQLLVALAIGLAWRPLHAIILPVERPIMAELIGGEALDITFDTPEGRPLRLTGYVDSADSNAAGIVAFALSWKGQGPTLVPYTIFAHFLDGQGNLIAQQDNWPVRGAWPTTCWQPGEVITDPYQLQLPQDLPAGEYTLVVGAYDGSSGNRLLTENGRDLVEIDRITVGP